MRLSVDRIANLLYLLTVFIGVYCIHASIGCDFAKCAEVIEDGINIHMVSHSHDDVGWVKTVGQYYNVQVRSILDTVVDALLANSQRKFIQVETAYLYMWWKEQTKQRKDQVRYLIKNGQLEIAGGAWSMNDEATAHYQSIIDGFTLGLRFINDTLGPCAAPQAAWQVDPFGHSRQTASLFAEFGFKALFFGRLDYRDKQFRITNKQMEMLWLGNVALGNASEIFTSVLYNLYQPPEGFCFDNVCGYTIGPYNEETKVKHFLQYIEEMIRAYKTNNILITMGGDFTYTVAHTYFGQIDYLIKSIKKRNLRTSDNKMINIFYSSPGCYYNAIKTMSNLNKLSVKTDDFFPYADKRNSYWTGYFTSRPTSKRYEREGNNLLQVSKQLAVLSRVGANRDIFDLSSAMGIMQHHDAITGTEKQFVADDYARLLHDGMQSAIIANGKRLESMNGVSWSSDLHTCTLSNMSICEIGSRNRFVVVLYNPLGYSVSQHVRIPVAYSKYSVRKSLTETIPHQISTPLRHFNETFNKDTMPYEITFLAENVPALGFKQFVISLDERDETMTPQKISTGEYVELGTKDLGMIINPSCNIISLYTSTHSIEFEQKLMFYNSKIITRQVIDGRPSGAYIFAPEGHAQPFPRMNCSVKRGPIFDEIRQEYESWAGQIVRIYKDNKKYVEFDWVVGTIQLEKFQGKEIISRFKSNLNSGYQFRTDTNGRSYINRQRNYRGSYEFYPDDEISSNYYPLTTYIGIEDVTANKYMTVFTDRAQGGASLQSGEVEIMLHRRLVQDDMLGVEEVLDERNIFMGAVARGQHRVNFGSLVQRDDEGISRELLLKPWMFLIPVHINDMNVWKVINKDYFGLNRELPKDIHLLTLEPWKKWEDKVLLRLEHINENGYSELLDLKNLFIPFQILDLRETNLAGNVWKEDDHILSNRRHHTRDYQKDYFGFQQLEIVLKPLQIKTFVATIKYYI